ATIKGNTILLVRYNTPPSIITTRMPKKTTMSCCVPIVCVRMAVLYHAVHHVSREKLDRPVWVIWPRVCRQGYTNPLRSCQGAARATMPGKGCTSRANQGTMLSRHASLT